MSSNLQRKVIKLWVAALKSDQYTENKTVRMTDMTGFSVYGVLCELLIDGGYKLNRVEMFNGVIGYGKGYGQAMIPEEISKLLKFKEDIQNNVYASIIIYKQMTKKSFDEMGDFIWKNRKLLFDLY